MPDKSYIVYMREMVGDNKFLLTAACVVIADEQNRVLLQQRSDTFKWGMPGGLMELEESIVDCAVREVKEETALDVRLTGFLGVFNNPMMRWRIKDEARILAFAFTGEIIGGTLRVNDSESVGFAWFGKDELPELNSPDTYEILEAYFNGKRNLVEGRSFE
jgi:8-oxo-dGTP pyrophosphatase MutT (NUDIX family)